MGRAGTFQAALAGTCYLGKQATQGTALGLKCQDGTGETSVNGHYTTAGTALLRSTYTTGTVFLTPTLRYCTVYLSSSSSTVRVSNWLINQTWFCVQYIFSHVWVEILKPCGDVTSHTHAQNTSTVYLPTVTTYLTCT